MAFEFDDFVLVVEVTLMASSRQEAAEGEPVRRHVADYMKQYEASGKTVYGLFIANSIDSNTAATFGLGRWYFPDDTELTLDIVPIPLSEFADLFEAAFSQGSYEPAAFRLLLDECLRTRHIRAPQWKKEINRQMREAINHLAKS